MSSRIPYAGEKISPTIRSVDVGYGTTSYGNVYGGNDTRAIAGRLYWDDNQGDNNQGRIWNPRWQNLIIEKTGNIFFNNSFIYVMGAEGRPLTGTGSRPVKIGGTVSVVDQVLPPSSSSSSTSSLTSSTSLSKISKPHGFGLKQSKEIERGDDGSPAKLQRQATLQVEEQPPRSSQGFTSSENLLDKEEQDLDDSIRSFLSWQNSSSEQEEEVSQQQATRQVEEQPPRSSQGFTSSENLLDKEEQDLEDSIRSFLSWQNSSSEQEEEV